MSCACHCAGAATHFNRKRALRDLERYRRHGPDVTTALLLAELRPVSRPGDTLLDIGGGIGVLEFELQRLVPLRGTVLVEAAPDCVQVARELHAEDPEPGRFRPIVGDVTEISPALTAEVVALDRVVCCYPDFRGLLKAAAEHSRLAIALTYPREVWYLKIVFKVVRFFQNLGKDPFRIFLHPISEMDALIQHEGFERVTLQRLFVWEMALYQKRGAAS